MMLVMSVSSNIMVEEAAMIIPLAPWLIMVEDGIQKIKI